jgi:hypothetical protein
MNFRPNLKKILFTFLIFVILTFLEVSTSCMGGAMICEPPMDWCSEDITSMTDEEYKTMMYEKIRGVCYMEGLSELQCREMINNREYSREMELELHDMLVYLRYFPSDCENKTCKRLPCGGIGGFPSVLTGTILFYAIYSLIEKKSK